MIVKFSWKAVVESSLLSLVITNWACFSTALGETVSTFPLGSTAPDVSMTNSAGNQISLANYFERKRIILLFVPNECSAEADGYLSHFSKLQKGLDDRDVQIVTVVEVGSPLLSKDFGASIVVGSQSDYIATTLSPNSEPAPLLLLIGKDKGVKLREKHFVPDKAIFATIDAMPMRKEEIKRKRQSGH